MRVDEVREGVEGRAVRHAQQRREQVGLDARQRVPQGAHRAVEEHRDAHGVDGAHRALGQVVGVVSRAASGVASSPLATSPASATTEVGRATLRRLVAECAAVVVEDEDEDEAAALTLACLAAAAAALAAAAAALMAVAAALASLYLPVSAAPLSARCAW